MYLEARYVKQTNSSWFEERSSDSNATKLAIVPGKPPKKRRFLAAFSSNSVAGRKGNEETRLSEILSIFRLAANSGITDKSLLFTSSFWSFELLASFLGISASPEFDKSISAEMCWPMA